MEDIKLYRVNPDKEGTRYKYSDSLFSYFYARLRYWGEQSEFFDDPTLVQLDYAMTKKDNSENGCRIWATDGTYVKIYSQVFYMEFLDGEWARILKQSVNRSVVRVSDIVNYFNMNNGPHRPLSLLNNSL